MEDRDMLFYKIEGMLTNNGAENEDIPLRRAEWRGVVWWMGAIHSLAAL